jgi:signal recognition particle receptor subunit beta
LSTSNDSDTSPGAPVASAGTPVSKVVVAGGSGAGKTTLIGLPTHAPLVFCDIRKAHSTARVLIHLVPHTLATTATFATGASL